MLFAPATMGVKLTVVAKDAPPVYVDEHTPTASAVAVAVVLALATNVTDGAGLPVQAVSFRMVVTGLSVVDGLTGVPIGVAGTVTLLTMI